MAFFRSSIWVDFAPASGSTIAIPYADSGTTVNAIISGTVALALLTITLPVTNVQDGQLIKIASNVGILGLTINAETGGLVNTLLTSLLAGGNGIYQFRKSNSTWYKFSS